MTSNGWLGMGISCNILYGACRLTFDFWQMSQDNTNFKISLDILGQ